MDDLDFTGMGVAGAEGVKYEVIARWLGGGDKEEAFFFKPGEFELVSLPLELLRLQAPLPNEPDDFLRNGEDMSWRPGQTRMESRDVSKHFLLEFDFWPPLGQF